MVIPSARGFPVQVMTTIAGFKPNDAFDEYDVPRSKIGLPGGKEPDELEQILFPNSIK